MVLTNFLLAILDFRHSLVTSLAFAIL